MAIRDSEFERLYGEHAQAVFRFLMYRTGDRWLSEDLLADTFEKVLRSRRPLPLVTSEKAWLYTIALNCVRDKARRAGVERVALERIVAEHEPREESAVLDTIGDRDEIQQALGDLSEEEREAIALRFGADLSVPEIARALGVALTTAEGRVYRGLRRLRALLG